MALVIGSVRSNVHVGDDGPARRSMTGNSTNANPLPVTQREWEDFLRPLLRALLDEELRRFQRSRS